MHPLALLLLQIAVVLVVARLVGIAFRKIGQPQVVGEMVAGILLGPSLLGAVAPALYAGLFPVESLPSLNVLSQIGLILFMFLIGLEFDPATMRGHGRTAVVTSYASIGVPFAMGIALSVYLFQHHAGAGLPGRPVTFWPFALFIGSAMSVTAFPVLARILTERNLLSTRLGTIAVACAAASDVLAWALLALVTAVATASGSRDLIVTLGGTTVYALAMVLLLRPALGRLEKAYASQGRLSNDLLGLILVLLLLSAFATEELGVHALFGAFVLGAVMPKEHGFVHALTTRLESLTVVLFLPLFFAFTGLKTQIGLLNEPRMWLDALIVLAVAVAGKFIGSASASRWSGLPWREASALGVLMNTRGLMELVFLSVGLELGVISPGLFVMMVLMAIATTFMTTPALDRIMPARMIRAQRADGTDGGDRFTVLMPVALPSSGPDLLAAAAAIAPPDEAQYVTLHLRPVPGDAIALPPPPDAPDPLAPTLAAAEARGLSVKTLAFASRDIGTDIVDTAEARDADLLLMGWHQPVLSESILGGTVADVLRRAPMDVAVLVNRTAGPWRRVLVPYAGGPHDRAALKIAQRLAHTDGVEVSLLHVVTPGSGTGGLRDSGERFGEVLLKVVEAADSQAALVDEARTGGYDLVIVGADEAWGLRPTLFGRRHEGLFRNAAASLLIVRGGKTTKPTA